MSEWLNPAGPYLSRDLVMNLLRPVTSVFRRPCGEFFRYPLSGRSLPEEQEFGRRLDGTPGLGEYRYSRPMGQVPLEQGKLYRLTPEQSLLRYRSIDEDIAGQFDYVHLAGPHQDVAELPVSCLMVAVGLGIQTTQLLWFRLSGARSHAFQDQCKQYVFAVNLSDGGARLLGFAHAYPTAP